MLRLFSIFVWQSAKSMAIAFYVITIIRISADRQHIRGLSSILWIYDSTRCVLCGTKIYWYLNSQRWRLLPDTSRNKIRMHTFRWRAVQQHRAHTCWITRKKMHLNARRTAMCIHGVVLLFASSFSIFLLISLSVHSQCSLRFSRDAKICHFSTNSFFLGYIK